MILLALVLYIVVACTLVAVPVALVQGSLSGRGKAGWPSTVGKTALAVLGLPFFLTVLGVYLLSSEMAQDPQNLWDWLFLWLMTFSFSMVPLLPLGFISFWLGKLVGMSKA